MNPKETDVRNKAVHTYSIVLDGPKRNVTTRTSYTVKLTQLYNILTVLCK